MRLFEAIIDANSRAVAGDQSAGLHPAEFEQALPIVALTCVDPRLNPLLPEVLGVPEESFIWLRNAGNIITGPLSSTMRSLALACAVKGGREIAVIGHTDCQVCKTTTMSLLDRLKQLGIERHLLPDNVNEYFGVFASERQNVNKACEIIRLSPIIGPKVPVHGLLLDIETGKLEWLVNGYQTWSNMADRWNQTVKAAEEKLGELKNLTEFQIGEMKFPETKIGETVAKAEDWLAQKLQKLEMKPIEPLPGSAPPVESVPPPFKVVPPASPEPPPLPPGAPKRIPIPPRIRPSPHFKRGR